MAARTVLVVGLGTMGMSHALAYARIEGFEVAGLCERRIAEAAPGSRRVRRFSAFAEALDALAPDVVSINTWSDTHADYAIRAMEAGAHVFVEKPWPTRWPTPSGWSRPRRRTGRKLVIGYILRHHPSWMRFIEIARTSARRSCSA